MEPVFVGLTKEGVGMSDRVQQAPGLWLTVTLDARTVRLIAMQPTADDRLWSEWLSRYLAHCREELPERELTALANDLDRAIRAGTLPDRDALVPERVARVAGPLIDFIAIAPSSAMRMALARDAAVRLRAAIRSR
jgi:hypothetical protein